LCEQYSPAQQIETLAAELAEAENEAENQNAPNLQAQLVEEGHDLQHVMEHVAQNLHEMILAHGQTTTGQLALFFIAVGIVFAVESIFVQLLMFW
jgi:hypothetical protein